MLPSLSIYAKRKIFYVLFTTYNLHVTFNGLSQIALVLFLLFCANKYANLLLYKLHVLKTMLTYLYNFCLGINRHFQMLIIHEKINNSLTQRISIQDIWQHLSEMYDLQALV